eukprot:scaffold3416_cov237-Alexandrium_tamarense.AAC.5
MDGDISIASLNWQSHLELVKLVKPKVSQATTGGTESGAYSSAHPKLRPVLDSRMIAAVTPIIEVGSSLFEVNTWHGYRDVVLKHVEVLLDVRPSGENCFDLSWCHYATATQKGHQDCGNIKSILYNDKYPTVSYSIASVTVSEVTYPSCVVFYQTPMIPVLSGERRSTYTVVFELFTKSLLQLCPDNREALHDGRELTMTIEDNCYNSNSLYLANQAIE